jgi:NAD(P)-dependent dehydrogenase (short-subunit alcohol dehydrogenase family)
MKRLANKTALITGAARGIGLAFAKAYVAEGARLAIADIDITRAQAAADQRPVRSDQQHLFARSDQRADRRREPRCGAGRDQHLAAFGRHPRARGVSLGNSFAQFGKSRHR